jgi:hypothetical protein
MDLSLKGLVSLETSDGFTKQQTKIRAVNPSKLRQILQEKRKKLIDLESNIITILPVLKSDFHMTHAQTYYGYFPGIAGAKSVYASEVEQDIDIPFIAIDYLTPMDSFGRDFLNEKVKEGLFVSGKRKQKNKELVPLTDWSRHVISYQYGRDPRYIVENEYRYLDNPIFDIKNRISIQGNHVRIISIEEGEQWGIHLESASLARTLSSLFQLLWSQATPITENVVTSWGENEMLQIERKRGRRR